jgi:hypothetical protein
VLLSIKALATTHMHFDTDLEGNQGKEKVSLPIRNKNTPAWDS